MISAKQVQLIRSLQHKKFRQKYNLFVVEGDKIIREVLASNFNVTDIFTTDKYFDSKHILSKIHLINDKDLKKISFLQHPKDALALVQIPEYKEVDLAKISFAIALDGIQDPGNLGTILRIADWFGIEHILCSEDTVDVYNPKVIQAARSSFTRVKVHYISLVETLSSLTIPLIYADMEGDDYRVTDFPKNAIIVFGNEGNGIRPELRALKHTSVSIPQINHHHQAESLNVAVSAAILIAHYRSIHGN